MLKDILGVEIRVGDIVAFPTRAGSYLGVNIAKVVDIEEVQDSGYNWRTRKQEPFIRHEVTVQSRRYDFKSETRTIVWGQKAKPNADRMVRLSHTVAEIEAMSEIDV